MRLIAQRCARNAAEFKHPQLADIKYDHRTNNGIVPVIEITGYPAELPKLTQVPF